MKANTIYLRWHGPEPFVPTADVLHFCSSRTSFLSYYKKEYGICDQFNNPGYGIRNRLVWGTFRKDYHKFEEMKLTPGKCSVVNAPLIEESPLCIECRVKEIVSLGSHDMFIADVVNIRADDRHLNRETGKLELAEANPLVYVHGGYYNLGEKIGKFGWSVEKKTK